MGTRRLDKFCYIVELHDFNVSEFRQEEEKKLSLFHELSAKRSTRNNGRYNELSWAIAYKKETVAAFS